jgi:hypothetical protein
MPWLEKAPEQAPGRKPANSLDLIAGLIAAASGRQADAAGHQGG